MKFAIVLLAVIGLINASPVAKLAKQRPALRADAQLTSGATVSMTCVAGGYTLSLTPADGTTDAEVTVALGTVDLAVDEDIDVACQESQAVANAEGAFVFAQRAYNACGGNMVTQGEDAEFTVSASIAEAVQIDGLTEDLVFSTVSIGCTFRLDDPDAANGNTNADNSAGPVTGDATINFNLSPVNVRTNRFEFTLAPDAGTVFPAEFTYNLVSCRSQRNPPQDGEEYVFLPAAGTCGRGVNIAEAPNAENLREFTISLPAHRFKGQTGAYRDAVVISCNVQLCRDSEPGCAPVTCPATPPVEPEPEPNPEPIEPEPEPNPEPVEPETRLRSIPVSPRKVLPKVKFAPKSGKVTLIK